MKLLYIFIVVFFLLFSSVATAKPSLDMLAVEKTLKEKVLHMISGYQKLPGQSQWQAMPKDTIKVLEAIVFDDDQWPVRRARAIRALAHFKSENTREFLVSVLKINGEAKNILKRRAIEVLAFVYGEESVSAIAELLQEEDYFIRETILKSLVKIGTENSLEVLRKHYKYETEKKLLMVIEDAFKRSGKAL